MRVISAPPLPLKILQEKLNTILHLVYQPKKCVTAFSRGRSIIDNARPHIDKHWVLNVDLESFFPSIHFGRVREALMAPPFNLPETCATTLAQICTLADGVLPQGAPTSPSIANIVCARMDSELLRIADRYRIQYTRYCDDLTFSCRQRQFPVAFASAGAGFVGEHIAIGQELSNIVESNGFRLNKAKSRLQHRAAHQEVTGLVVNARLNIAREYVRVVRSMLYTWETYGVGLAAQRFLLCTPVREAL